MSRDAPDANARRLAARLLAEAGVHPAAPMVGRVELEAVVVAALEHGGAHLLGEITGERRCRVCGCTRHRACRNPEPCAWVADDDDLCTACAPYPEDAG